MQIKEIKFLKIPEYFTKMKDRYQDLGFIGASIVAKVIKYIKKKKTFLLYNIIYIILSNLLMKKFK